MRNDAAVRTWSAGDYSRIAARLPIVAEQICESAGLRPGWNVLDVATGTGNAALAAARRMCRVTAVDCVPELVERGRERARAEGLEVQFKIANAESLEFPAAKFDSVLSTFGVMFADDDRKAAREIARVCRPGGRIALANWTPGGFIGEYFRAGARHLDPPPAMCPTSWGDEEHVSRLLTPYASALRISRRFFRFHHLSEADWLEEMKRHYGPTKLIFGRASRPEVLHADLMRVIRNFNRASDGAFLAEAEYLEVIVTRNERPLSQPKEERGPFGAG